MSLLGSSDLQRHWINHVLPTNNIPINGRSLAELVRQLHIEGDDEQALLVRMRMRQCRKSMDMTGVESYWNGLGATGAARTKLLRHLLSHDDYDVAWRLMNAMIENRVANIVHFNVMISRACGDAAQREDVMDQMIELGVSPDVLTYNALLTQLISEGKITRAKNIMESVMPSVDVTPDARTQFIMTRKKY